MASPLMYRRHVRLERRLPFQIENSERLELGVRFDEELGIGQQRIALEVALRADLYRSGKKNQYVEIADHVSYASTPSRGMICRSQRSA